MFEEVAVVGGCSLAKLGMKFQGHLAKGHPIIEDVLAGFAAVVGRDDGCSPILRLDAVGRHTVGAGGAQQAILEALTVRPLMHMGLRLTDVDRYATELHNPEATEPAGSGNVPLLNYRLLAALAVARGEVGRQDLASFVGRHGLPGFSPTQGHIASAVPYLAHALDGLTGGSLRRVMFLAKGSLFLGRMTQMSDGPVVHTGAQPARGTSAGGRMTMELKGKKVIAIGERDGVPGPAIARCAAEAGAEVVMEMTHRFV